MIALECRQVTVRFGAVTALAEVSVAFDAGQIHAVVGQNGAGKTTFARLVAGLVAPTLGEVTVAGQRLRGGDVGASRAAGVELVHQSFALPPAFTVAEAMEFGASGAGRLFSRRGLARKWQAHVAALDLKVGMHRRIRDLPVETQQGLEIARALVREARVLILDEPTAVLSPAGIAALFARVRRLKARGITVILILHKIREVLALADTVTVLCAGRKVAGPLPVAEVSPEALSTLIIGAAAPAPAPPRRPPVSAAPLLRLQGLATRPDAEGAPLAGIDLDLAQGEILGIAGVEGNGQRTLVRALAGLAEVASGCVTLDGVEITGRSLAERRAAGLRIIPFERNTEGLSLTSTLWENWSVRDLLRGPLLRPLRPRHLRAACDRALRAWGVRYHGPGQRAGALSGGNAQKVILAREIDPEARLILAAQPTRGLDIGATAFVWQALRLARDRGAGIVLISSDLDELFDICDRVAVMLSGRITGVFRPPCDLAAVGAAMTGAAMTKATLVGTTLVETGT